MILKNDETRVRNIRITAGYKRLRRKDKTDGRIQQDVKAGLIRHKPG